MSLLINLLVLACVLFYACKQEKPGLKAVEVMKVQKPVISGEWQHIFNPNDTRWEEDSTWYTNDHCFVEDKEENLHWFGINNPYPPKGKELYSYHPYLGHLKTKTPTKEWERLSMVLNEINGTEYIGAPYVIWHEESKRYAMEIFSYRGKQYATSCDPEDQHYLNHQSVPIAGLGWLKQ